MDKVQKTLCNMFKTLKSLLKVAKQKQKKKQHKCALLTTQRKTLEVYRYYSKTSFSKQKLDHV